MNREQMQAQAGMCDTEVVHIPAWARNGSDGNVRVRGMTLREFEVNQSRTDEGKATASVIVRCVVDEGGGRELKDEDAGWVAEWPLAQAKLVSAAIMRLSGMDDDEPDQDKAADKAVADAEGNSEATPDDSSSSV